MFLDTFLRRVSSLVGSLVFQVPSAGLLLLLGLPIHAQPWSGIISPSRATDWRTAGANIVNRTTQCGATINAYSGTAAVINTAISNCPAGQFVQLGSGTFNLSTGVEVSKSSITLRGMGADSTKLIITGITADSCHWGLGRVVNMCTNGGTNIGIDSPENTATWSSGYSQGTTVITLSSTNGLAVGSTIWLDQLDDTADYPNTGDVRSCMLPDGVCSNHDAGEDYTRPGRGLVEGHVVTAISGSNVTIEPAIYMPTFRASQTPQAWWGNAGTILHDSGIENLTIQLPTSTGGIYVVNGTNVWIKGVRTLQLNPASSNAYHISTIQCVHCTFTDNYLYGPPTTQLVNIYGFALHILSASLVQNNILHSMSAAIVLNSANYGNVYAFNYINQTLGASIIEHSISAMNLYEGNDGSNHSADIIQSTHHFGTLFRNYWNGQTHNTDVSETEAGIALYARARFYNSIGNVFGATNWTAYQSVQAHNPNAIYELGWQGTGSGTAVPNDPYVAPTFMRWGNWDNVTNAVRWCGNSSNTGWSTTCGSTSEIPTTIQDYPNPVPASQTLPNSFYLSAVPSTWWGSPYGSVPWPAIGPDVTGSTLATTGGHAYKIPARLCFDNAANDPAYPSSSPGVKVFNASKCYIGSTGTVSLGPPTVLSASVQ